MRCYASINKGYKIVFRHETENLKALQPIVGAVH